MHRLKALQAPPSLQRVQQQLQRPLLQMNQQAQAKSLATNVEAKATNRLNAATPRS